MQGLKAPGSSLGLSLRTSQLTVQLVTCLHTLYELNIQLLNNVVYCLVQLVNKLLTSMEFKRTVKAGIPNSAINTHPPLLSNMFFGTRLSNNCLGDVLEYSGVGMSLYNNLGPSTKSASTWHHWTSL